jgi:CRISPR-associated protein Csb2
MIGLQIEFVAGQFHATPWDRATNEGEIEWPPAPWRLLRSIVAGWYRTGAAEREALMRVLDTLAECPVYDLPLVSSGHTRHYVPLGGLKASKPERTLMLDSFIALDREREHATRAFAIWPAVTLDSDERRVLETCCSGIRYFGRAESWCEVTVVSDVPFAEGRFRVDLASRDASDGPTLRRLAASPSQRGRGLLQSLTEMTSDMRRARRTMPSGTVWVDYRMPLDFGWVTEQATARDIRKAVIAPTVLRFAVDPESGVLPRITDAVTIAEKMRQAALKRHSAINGAPASKRLAGKKGDGSERREGHDHPFYLPLDRLGRGVVDAVDIWLPHGCTADEFRALSGISRIWDPVVLEGAFAITYLGQVMPEAGTEWSTVTPVVLDRFPKRRGPAGSVILDAPEEQLRRALKAHGLGEAVVEVWSPRETIAPRLGGRIRLDAFRRARIGDRTIHPAVGATLRFDEPVSGPIVLGRLAHFGLGRFAPVVAAVAPS